MRDLPNLNALRVFSVAADCESFTRAADLLGVTQSAVSKQVAALEAQLGQALFLREHRRITLTPYGAALARVARDGLQDMRVRMAAIGADAPRQIRLAVDADFAQLWLFPRLPDFEARHPDIRVTINAQVALNGPPRQDHDCAIIWGRGNWAGCRFQPLMTNTVFPVAAPGFFGPGTPPDLQAVPGRVLIHDQSTFWWSAFYAAAGVDGFDPDAGRIYNQTALCLTAAARGDGVTVGDEVTTREYLADGRLICPWPDRLPSPDAYYLATPGRQPPRPQVRAFADWLADQARAQTEWFAAYWARDRARS